MTRDRQTERERLRETERDWKRQRDRDRVIASVCNLTLTLKSPITVSLFILLLFYYDCIIKRFSMSIGYMWRSKSCHNFAGRLLLFYYYCYWNHQKIQHEHRLYRSTWGALNLAITLQDRDDANSVATSHPHLCPFHYRHIYGDYSGLPSLYPLSPKKVNNWSLPYWRQCCRTLQSLHPTISLPLSLNGESRTEPVSLPEHCSFCLPLLLMDFLSPPLYISWLR